MLVLNSDYRLLNFYKLIAYIFFTVQSSYHEEKEQGKVKMGKYLLYDKMRNAYIMRSNENKYTATTNQALAERFESEIKAENVLRSSINKALRNRYEVICINESNPQQTSTKYEYKPASINFKEISDKLNRLFASSESNDLFTDLQELQNHIASSQSIINNMGQKMDLLSDEWSKIDKAINDVEHYIEFYSFNAFQGYAICKLLQDLRKRRRIIKMQQELVHQLKPFLLNNRIHNIDTTKFDSLLESQENKKYAPRILTELWERRTVTV